MNLIISLRKKVSFVKPWHGIVSDECLKITSIVQKDQNLSSLGKKRKTSKCGFKILLMV
jgi:hypothetical protein